MAKFLFTQFQNVELIVKDGNPLGGSVVETLVWMKSLNDLGQDIVQVSLEDDRRIINEDFLTFQLLPLYHSKKGIKWLRWPLYRFPKTFIALNKCSPDYLYESIPSWGSFFLGSFCKSLGIKHIIRIANDNMLDERIKITHSKFDIFFIFLGFKICDFIIAQNDYQYARIQKRFPNKKILKLHNPIEIDDNFGKCKRSISGYIAWVANFRYQKNLKLLFEICSNLPDENFKIAGSHLSYIDDETKTYIDKLKELSNVEFVGKVSRDKILEFLANSKFLLNTSRYEGFSNTFLEAMVAGTPILTPINVNPDGIIEKFDLGILYNESNELIGKLKDLTEDRYFQKSKNCINYVEENHNHLVIGEKLLKFLKER